MADITIQRLRKEYSQYDNWSDEKLAEKYTNKTGRKVDMGGASASSKSGGGSPSLTPDSRPKWTENFYGAGEIDTVGEDIGAAIGSGMERGAAAVIGLPGAFSNTVEMGLDKFGLGLRDEGDRAFGFPEAMEYMDNLTGDAGVGTGYKPDTRAGKYAQTGADFFAGAVMPGAAFKNLGNTVAAPAVVSETLGQLTEGTKLEPYARMLGGLFGGRTADILENAVAGGKVTPEHARAVDALRKYGVKPTAGQATDHNRMLYAEDGSRRGQALMAGADDSFTQAALNMAAPPALKSKINLQPGDHPTVAITKIADGIGDVMDGLAARNKIPLNDTMVDGLSAIAVSYKRAVSRGAKSPFFKSLADDLAALPPGAALKGDAYQQIRSQLSQMTRTDPITKQAAIASIKLLDDAMEASIKATGNKTDLALYKQSREAYSNLLILEKALGRSADDMPTITPSALAMASRAKDLRAYVQGRTTFDELFRAGKTVLKKPRDSGTAQRLGAQFGNAAPAMAAASTTALMGGGPEAAAAAAALGISAAPFRNNVLASRPVQKWMEATARRGDRSGVTSIPAAISASRQGQY